MAGRGNLAYKLLHSGGWPCRQRHCRRWRFRFSPRGGVAGSRECPGGKDGEQQTFGLATVLHERPPDLTNVPPNPVIGESHHQAKQLNDKPWKLRV
jgi:hypothetical protein